jgi:hypothetical protein
MPRESAPKVEVELIPYLAGSRARQVCVRAQAVELLEQVDFTRLAAELDARRLLPLIGSRAVELDPEGVPISFQTTVQLARARARAHGMAIDFTMRHVVGLLDRASIAALPLKGTTLAARAHGDLGLRETADVDLLVGADRLDDAVAALQGAGFRPPSDYRPGHRPDLHWTLERPGQPRIEVHWRVHWYETAFSRDMLRRATRGEDGLLRPTNADLAAALLLFYARDGFYGVRIPADLAAWFDRHAEELAPDFLAEYPQLYPELAPALTAAARVSQALTGVPAIGWLGPGAIRSRRVQLATRLTEWSQEGDPAQLWANISLVGGLLGPAGSGSAFVKRELLGKANQPAATAAHVIKTLGRYVLALLRAVRRPTPLAQPGIRPSP